MTHMNRALSGIATAAFAIVCLWAPAYGAADAAQLDRMFPKSTLQIATPDARLHPVKVWVADTMERRARGLMFVKHLEDSEGMLFIYERPQPVSMWMKNTLIPLDMLFVAADGKIIRVAANTKPHSLDTIDSQGDAIAVIELKGGMAAKLKITEGARVLHPLFNKRS